MMDIGRSETPQLTVITRTFQIDVVFVCHIQQIHSDLGVDGLLIPIRMDICQ